jgi:methylene-fatty-acyl-phospholipid synthase
MIRANRPEFNHGVITKIAGGKKKNGCYLLAATIFLLGIFRDYLYEQALRAQPTAGILDDIAVRLVGVALFLGGNILVLSSMYQLGITGTYLGDYFGILMDSRVTAFPFNVTDNPMYYGSFMSFLGTALYYGKIAGIYISVFVLIMYVIALRFEEPFTAAIYSRRAEQLRKKAR